MTVDKPQDDSAIKPRGNVNRFRLPIRILCLAAAILCLWPVRDNDVLLALVPSLSPFVALASIVATRSFQLIFIPGLVTAVIVTVKHRLFCRWICPLGLCMDTASQLGRSFNRKPCQSLAVGKWIFALTLGGAALGCPLLLFCDPLSLFAGLFLFTEKSQILTAAISAAFILLLLILSVVRPHLWCRGLCPLGAAQDIFAAMARSVKTTRKPAADSLEKVRPSHHLQRRTLLGIAAGAASAAVFRFTGGASAKPLRPPGAVDEQTFKTLCTRCGTCIRSCPYKIISRDQGQNGLASLLTPVLSFEKDYCREDCTRCTRLCPSGALTKVDIGNKPEIKIGIPQVDMKICLLGEDRECAACMRWCPYSAIKYVFSETEYTLIPVIDQKKCNGCGACQKACPTSPTKAITISP